jgi:hypothetical protein
MAFYYSLVGIVVSLEDGRGKRYRTTEIWKGGGLPEYRKHGNGKGIGIQEGVEEGGQEGRGREYRKTVMYGRICT